MKKKHRDIVIDGEVFGYVVKHRGKERHVMIYRDRKPIFGIAMRIPSVLPSHIEEIIRNNKLGGRLKSPEPQNQGKLV